MTGQRRALLNMRAPLMIVASRNTDLANSRVLPCCCTSVRSCGHAGAPWGHAFADEPVIGASCTVMLVSFWVRPTRSLRPQRGVNLLPPYLYHISVHVRCIFVVVVVCSRDSYHLLDCTLHRRLRPHVFVYIFTRSNIWFKVSFPSLASHTLLIKRFVSSVALACDIVCYYAYLG